MRTIMAIQKAKQSVSIVGKVVTFVCHLGGIDIEAHKENGVQVWKDGFFVHVTVDFTGATELQLIDCSSSSQGLRVKLQGIWRKYTLKQLRGIELNGYKCKFTDVWGVRQVVVQQTYPEIIAGMSEADGVKQLMSDLGIKHDIALTYYKKITIK